MSERYSFSLTTFSPSGKLVQIEYALEAVKQGTYSRAQTFAISLAYAPFDTEESHNKASAHEGIPPITTDFMSPKLFPLILYIGNMAWNQLVP